MDTDWIMFVDTYAGDLHPTFRQELSRQLWDKSDQTGIRNFKLFDFHLIVGLRPLEMTYAENSMQASVDFITPTSFSFPVTISWAVSEIELLEAHKGFVDKTTISFNWGTNFPKDEIMQHVRALKKTKAIKNGFGIDVHYFPTQLPDILLELYFTQAPDVNTLTAINIALQKFKSQWDEKNRGKEIQFISDLTLAHECGVIVLDVGLKNSFDVIDELLRAIGDNFQKIIHAVAIK